MNIGSTMLLICVSGCFGNSKSPDEAYNSLFEVSGYPKAGDIPTLNRKIFKGMRVAIREHPYIVSIRRQFSHYLTGTLITRTLVLTVAHPLYLVPIQELGVVMGENYADRGTMVHTVIVIVVHENFDPYSLANDIAMLKIYEEPNDRTSVKEIQLLAVTPLNSTKAFVTGWGRCDMTGRELCMPRGTIYHSDEKMDPMLRTITFDIILPNYYCDGYKRLDAVLQPGMLCVGEAREENSVAPCLAVPGAPLVVEGRLAGLQSWGFGCGYSHDLPLIYTSTQHYEHWIWYNKEMFNMLTQENYTELFEATRAYISYAWLMETKLVKLNSDNVFPQHIQEISIENVLSSLNGNYYDIRDFIDNGRYHESKVRMINSIWKKQERMIMINKTQMKLQKGVPFIRNYLLVDDDNKEKYEYIDN